MREYPYTWTLKNAQFSKDRGKVFSCFSCGGGSSMGYKLSGFDVIGCNEIDPKMMDTYIRNHHPKFSFLESIETFKTRQDLPDELFDLDILDGSPPCSSFSMAGNREKDWGKEKKFREGQAEQVLDNLFFDFIDLAEKLRPKVVIAENVTGLLLGAAFEYVRKIYNAFDKAGYTCQHWKLDASDMGVPQQRQRVFFVCLRKDLADQFMEQVDLFSVKPMIDMEFTGRKIPFSEIEEHGATEGDGKLYPSVHEMWKRTIVGGQMIRNSGAQAISHYKLDPTKVLYTIIGQDGAGAYHHELPRTLTKSEYCKAGTFPMDYDFMENKTKYMVGMSVPPVMMARVADRVWDYWLSQIEKTPDVPGLSNPTTTIGYSRNEQIDYVKE